MLTAKSWLVLLPPKIGSRWIVAAMQAAGVRFEDVGEPHAERDRFSGVYAGVASFVRHPVAWHASYWAYRNSDRSEWDHSWELDARCGSENWSAYIEAATTRCPGYVSRMFARYTGDGVRGVDFVGRQERLRIDLVRLLNLMEETFDAGAIHALPDINVSSGKPTVTAGQRSAIYLAEKEMYARYGYSR